MLLSIGSATSCAFTCSITGGGQTINGVSQGSYAISQKTYYYFNFPGLTAGTPYTYTCTSSIRRTNLATAVGKNHQASSTAGSTTMPFVFPRNQASGQVRVLAFGDWSNSQVGNATGPMQTIPSTNAYGPLTLNWLNSNRANYYDAFLFAGDMGYDLYANELFNPINKAAQNQSVDNGTWGNAWMAQVNGFLANQPLFFSPGNHENMEPGMYNLNRFNMPNKATQNNQYFSVDIGPVHAVSINSNLFSNFSTTNQNATLQKQISQWLVNDLASTTQPWKIVFMHQPLYCSPASSSHCGNTAAYTQNLLENTFINGKVDLVLTGHVHDYERFGPMNNGVVNLASATNNNTVFTNPGLPIYICSGAPGNNEGVGTTAQMQPLIAGSLVAIGSDNGPSVISEFNATSTNLNYQTIVTSGANAGQVIDSMTIVKTGKK